jgi:hypothetical protein
MFEEFCTARLVIDILSLCSKETTCAGAITSLAENELSGVSPTTPRHSRKKLCSSSKILLEGAQELSLLCCCLVSTVTELR